MFFFFFFHEIKFYSTRVVSTRGRRHPRVLNGRAPAQGVKNVTVIHRNCLSFFLSFRYFYFFFFTRGPFILINPAPPRPPLPDDDDLSRETTTKNIEKHCLSSAPVMHDDFYIGAAAPPSDETAIIP